MKRAHLALIVALLAIVTWGCTKQRVRSIGQVSARPLVDIHVGTNVKLYWPHVEYYPDHVPPMPEVRRTRPRPEPTPE